MKFDPASRIQHLKQHDEYVGVNPSITDSSTYTFRHADDMEETFLGHLEGCFLYSRHWNPTNKNLAEAMAAMEDTESAWITASGMAAIKPNTKVIYTESVTNPLLQVSDIPKLAEIAHQNGTLLMVDNTFTPMIMSPARMGADIVVYSMTKFINGKNDCVAGAICGSRKFVDDLSNVNNGTAMYTLKLYLAALERVLHLKYPKPFSTTWAFRKDWCVFQ